MGRALANVAREYPNKPDHVLNGPSDLATPRAQHPVFFGSYDWHSSVHMHWTMARCLRIFPSVAAASAVSDWFDSALSPDRVAAECAYLEAPQSASFERTYGWAWLLLLQSELMQLAGSYPRAASWATNLQPLADAFAGRFVAYLPKLSHPVRTGTHANSAFSLVLAHEYATIARHPALRVSTESAARAWFGSDARYPARYEPSGEDFLSAGLVEAALMTRIVGPGRAADWWRQFSPPETELSVWLAPVAVGDRTDPRLAHLDGLNLSRAWCWKLLAPVLAEEHRGVVRAAIGAHLDASLPHAVEGNYMGTHWLASFALLALTA